MSEVLKDLSTQALATAVEANMYAYFRYLGGSAGAELCDSPSMRRLVTGVSHPFLNAVFLTELTSGELDEAIEQALAHFKSREMPFMWWAGSPAQPADLGKSLEAHGLDYTEDFLGMAADLQALNEDLPTPSRLTIVPVGDKEMLAHWVRAALIGFRIPGKSESAFFDLYAGLGFGLPLRSYVGLLDGKPVSTSQLFLGAGVAGIYVVATVPEARRQGVGTALTLAPLRDAREMGYRVGILHPSERGLGVYRRLGFEVNCRLCCGIWGGIGEPVA